MEYYAIQVWTGKEDEYAAKLETDPSFQGRLIIPKKVNVVRRHGKSRREERPFFPGYIFIASEDRELGIEHRWAIKTTRYFVRTLPQTSEPKPIKDADRRLLSHIISFGKVADVSKVSFDADDRIVVLEGPMKGLEGLIVKVDKRKRRAKLKLDICENSFLVDLGFELLEKPPKGSVSDDAQHSRAP